MPLTLPSKSIQMADYDTLGPALRHLNYTLARAKGKEWFVGLAHPHRLWEYGSAITAMTEAFGGDLTGRRVIDVGSGPSALGPTLALRYHCRVVEADPSKNVAPLRAETVEGLQRVCRFGYQFVPMGLAEVEPAGAFDGVFCISVLEHLPEAEQEPAWRKLAALLAPGGVLVATIDYGDPDRTWRCDTDRAVKLGSAEVERICGWLREEGVTLTDVDPTNHGPQVADYTFFRLIGQRGRPA